MDAMILITSTVAAGAVVLISYGFWSLATADKTRVAWRINRTGVGNRQRLATAADVRLQGRSNAVFSPIDRAISKYGWVESARHDLHKAEINLHVSEFVAIRIIVSLLVLAIPLLVAFTNGLLLVGFAGAGAALFVWWQIGAFVTRRIKRRQSKIEDQLDEALVSIAGSLRAGFTFSQACQMSLGQMTWPLKDEIQEMLEEVTFGASQDDALRSMAERIQSYEVDILVNAVLVQRQVGGSLAEILDNVARTMRDRRELRGHIMALTAQQRLSAYFVAGVPVLMAAFLSLTSWDFMRPLFVSLVGNVLLAFGFIMNVLGFLVMRRLTRIDF